MRLNLNEEYATADVARLISSKDDTRKRQLRVTKDGFAYLSDTIGARDIDGLAFRMETWGAGNGYTGEQAAKDPMFISRVEKVLRDNWPKASMSYIDFF